MNSSPNNPKLVARGIKKSFGATPVLDNVSLELREGELVSLLGLSGSGKTTVFNIVAGLIRPDEGEVFIDGQNLTGVAGRISYMYQKDLLLPWRTILDNVSLPLLIQGETRKAAREKASGYFKKFGLEGFERKYPFQLSGGMRQRAALMRTFFYTRDVMLLDEPFGSLDALTKMKMEEWLLEVLPELRTAVLLITHDVEEAVLLSDRIYILSDRPARVKEEISVEIPKPRNFEMTTSAEFNTYKKHILKTL